MKGYIYLRDNKWFQHENIIKLGVSKDIINRGSVYITSEFIRGKYILVIEIPHEILHDIDIKMKRHFKPYHVYKDGGTEFYKRDIIDLVVLFIQSSSISYKVLSEYEMDLLERTTRIYSKVKSYVHTNIEKIKENIKKINPLPHQQYVLNKIEQSFHLNSIGKIIWACGMGKTYMMLYIIQRMKYKFILIGVPSTYLQKQLKENISEIFRNYTILYVGGDTPTQLHNINRNHLKKPIFVISTYHSCKLLLDITFDFKVGDEAHHLVGNDSDFRNFHKINSTHTLFMTATEKISNMEYSMDDSNFGSEIDSKSIKWAIENKIITDYNILVLKNTLDDVHSIIQHSKINVSNKDLFMSCYMCLKSIIIYNDLSHVLLYTNTIDDSELAQQYINQLLPIFNITQIYNKSLHSNNCKNLHNEIELFKKEKIGIISCVYIMGEGVNIPELNGVCIAGTMNSEIRIVQYLLRPNRKYLNKEKAYIIIPYIDTDEWDDENNSFEKVRYIIKQMRNDDDLIQQKIKVFTIQKKNKQNEKENIEYEELYENTIELEKIKIRLRHSKSFITEEQDEYNYERLINIENKIDSIQRYNLMKNKILDPVNYFKKKGVWINWYHFFGIDTINYIQSKEEWIKFCKKINVKSNEDYDKKTLLYDILPKNPSEFYDNFTTINNELGIIIRRHS